MHRWLFVAAVALLGMGAALWFGRVFDLYGDEMFAVITGPIVLLPAGLAALPRKAALTIGLIVIGLGLVWMVNVFSLPGDSAIGGIFIGLGLALFALLLGVVVGLGSLVDRWAARRKG